MVSVGVRGSLGGGLGDGESKQPAWVVKPGLHVGPRPRRHQANWLLVTRLGKLSSPERLLFGLEDAAQALPSVEVESPLDPNERVSS